jgi:hypothetical protein
MGRRNSTAVLKFAVKKKRLVKSARPSRRRQSAASAVGEAKAERLAALEAKALHWIARGRAANVELGRVFLQIKDIVGHGRWERYYAERFGSCGVAQRTAQTYMQLAREEDDISKSAASALFPPAADPQTQAINAATERAQAEVGGAARDKVRKEQVRLEGPGLYELPPIHRTGDEMDACNELVNSHWPRAEEEIIALLKQLYVECGIVPGGNS